VPTLARIAYGEMLILLGGFFGVVFWQLLTRPSALSGLLQGDRYDGPNRDLASVDFTAGRAQLLIFTLYFAVYYLIQILHSSSGFPPIPDTMLYVLGGSQATYLGGKSYDIVLRRMMDNFKKGLTP
jgi:hypothetical protein